MTPSRFRPDRAEFLFVGSQRDFKHDAVVAGAAFRRRAVEMFVALVEDQASLRHPSVSAGESVQNGVFPSD